MIQVKHDESSDVVIAAGLRSPWVRAGGASCMCQVLVARATMRSRGAHDALLLQGCP